MRLTISRRIVAAVVSALCLLGTLGLASSASAEAAVNNNQTAYEYFVTKGLTKYQSAGIVGNLIQESGNPINPRATQYPSGPGRGIAQWSVNERWATLLNYASARGRDPWSLSLQLDFIWYELTGTEANAMRQLRAATTLDAATLAFSRYYERCGTCHNDTRIAYARQVYNAYAGVPTPTETSFPTLRQGSTGTAVTTLQYALRAKGHSIAVDGAFGSGTLNAVKAFQRSAGLTIDGVVGPLTWNKVLPQLSQGSSGDAVRALQVELRAHGHSVTVDGVFGSATRSAVVAYQTSNRLGADGIVGIQTWGSLVD